MSFFFFVRWRKEREDRDRGNDYWALAAWESGWRKTSVFAVSLSQNINFLYKVLLPGRIGWASLTWFVHLISDWINPALISLFFFLGCMHEKGVGFIRSVMVVDSIWSHLLCMAIFTMVESQEGSAGILLRFITGEHSLFWSSYFFLTIKDRGRDTITVWELLSKARGVACGSDVFLGVLSIILRKIGGRLAELPHGYYRGRLLPGDVLCGNL